MVDKKGKGRTKERSKDVQPTRTKERKEPVPLVIRSYLIESPSCPFMSLASKSRDLILVEGLK